MKRKIVLTMIIPLMTAILTGSSKAQIANESFAKIWQQDIVLPTYLIGKDGSNPRFYNGRA